MPIYIQNAASLSTLGNCPTKIFSAFTQPNTYGYLINSSEYVNGLSVPIGKVPQTLHSVPTCIAHLSSRNVELLLTCVQPLLNDLQKLIKQYGNDRIGIILGSSNSGIEEGENALRHASQEGALPRNYSFTQQEMGAGAEALRLYLKLAGPAYVISTACSSSAKVFQSATQLLQAGLCDAVLVGGSDPLCSLATSGFAALQLLSENTSLPFSKNRSGINIGEAAALFILTKQTGGVQLLGVGEASDAYHFSSPHPEGLGALQSMQKALAQANLNAEQINYINLHGTGTIHNDQSEAKAVRTIFSDQVYCSSTKPLTGHTLGASGALEAAFCWQILDRYRVAGELYLPVHVYDGYYDPELPSLNLVTHSIVLKPQNNAYCLSNSFGFGGSNCSLIFGAGYYNE